MIDRESFVKILTPAYSYTEDSEPLFGLWFESTLVAPDAVDSGLVRASTDGDDTDGNGKSLAIVPDKAEPYSVSNI